MGLSRRAARFRGGIATGLSAGCGRCGRPCGARRRARSEPFMAGGASRRARGRGGGVMRVLAYRGPNKLVLEEREVPRAGDGEVVVHVDACSICGTDLRIAAGSHRVYVDAVGRVPGHEIAATVVDVGEGAEATLGARVFVAPNYGCGRCRACLRGDVNLCVTPRAIGISEDGGFAAYVLLPAELVAQGNLLACRDGFDAGTV